MIENIIFDMGNVLMNFRPLTTLKRYLPREEDVALTYKALFEQDWQGLDDGSKTEEEVAAAACAVLPAHLHPAVRAFMEHWPEDMPPIAPMWDLVRELKAKGCGLYLLSNAGLAFHTYSKRTPGFELFDGMVISADERCVKPNPRIYQILLERYALPAETCLFIDDLAANIEGARALGIAGIRFDGERMLRYELKALGIL